MNFLPENIQQLARPNIRAIKPYASARDEAPDATRSIPTNIMLDANENSLGGPLSNDYTRYPDPHQRPLKQAFAALKAVSPDQIFLGNGSDEAIDLLLRAFVEPGRDNILLLPPTYGMYAVQANIHGAIIRTVPLTSGFMPDAEAIKQAIDAHSKLLFLCSPNNPTGQCLPAAFIRDMLATFPGLVVVDEAYVDFAESPSWIGQLDSFPNLVVLQTLSKAWGLAGLRIGGAFAHKNVVQLLHNIKYPYNLNTSTIQLATEALKYSSIVAAKVDAIRAERTRLATALTQKKSVVEVFPSDANFLLVRVTDADALYQQLANNGVIVRNRSREIHCHNCLRITVGTPEENDTLLSLIP